jgi:glycine betaine catabolism A
VANINKETIAMSLTTPKPTSLDPDAIDHLIASRQVGWSLPQPFYTDDAIFARDMEQVYRAHWLFAGHTTQIPNVGDYFLYNLGNDSVIVIRDEDGTVHAHHNSCRHRGSVLCVEPEGWVKKFVCPYHQWVFEKNGTLASARLMGADFDKSQFSLHPVAVEVVEGLIFLSFADNPPDFSEAKRASVAHLKPYQMANTKIIASEQYDLACNWKMIAENFRECYHCGNGHPEYCEIVIGSTLLEPHEKMAAIHADRRAHWQSLGLSTEIVDFTPQSWFHCTRYPFRPGYVSESLDGDPVAPLLGTLTDRDAGVFAIVSLPNFWLEASSDYVWTMRLTPLSPTRTIVDTWWSVRADAEEGKDYSVDCVTAFWKATGGQDWTFCVNNQAGVNSSRYVPGPYAPHEMGGVEVFEQWYLNCLKGQS